MSESDVSKFMEIGEVLSILESSFQPLKCVAELIDYKSQIKFCVFDKDGNKLVNWPEISIASIRNEITLNEIVTATKTNLKTKGFHFSE